MFPGYNTPDSLEWGREGKEGVGQEVKEREKSRDEAGDKGIRGWKGREVPFHKF
jgi:hypothetical protein